MKGAALAREKALVLFSGGQDSTTCLAWALENFAHVETLGFDYRQRHWVELSQRGEILKKIRAINPDWAKRLGDDHLFDLAILGQISETAMTREIAIEASGDGLPNTFVPGRNLIFMTFAAALAYRRGLKILVTGVCETDFSGYPDCRDDTMKSLQVALNLGMETKFAIATPLMWLSKAQIFSLAQQLGGADLMGLIVEETHTCYVGERGMRHEWGYGCGMCPACRLRADGFHEWKRNCG